MAPWGTPPATAQSWQLSRQQGDKFERCTWYNRQTGVADQEWPLEALTADRIVKRWGGGTYRIQWMGRSDGKAKGLGKSRAFRFDGAPPRPVYPNPPAPGQAEPEAAPPLGALVAPSASTSAVLQDFKALHDLAMGGADKVLSLLMAVHAQNAAAVKTDPQLVAALQQVGQRLESIEQRLADLEEEEEDADAEEGEAQGAAPGVLVGPGGERVELNSALQTLLVEGIKKYGPNAIEALARKALGGAG